MRRTDANTSRCRPGRCSQSSTFSQIRSAETGRIRSYVATEAMRGPRMRRRIARGGRRGAPAIIRAMPDFVYQPIFEHGHDETPYRQLTREYVSVEKLGGREILSVDPRA